MPTPLKNMKVSWDDDIPKIWNNKKCYKPPNQYIYICIWQPTSADILGLKPLKRTNQWSVILPNMAEDLYPIPMYIYEPGYTPCLKPLCFIG